MAIIPRGFPLFPRFVCCLTNGRSPCKGWKFAIRASHAHTHAHTIRVFMVEPGPAEDGGIPSKIFCRLEHTLSLYLSLLSLADPVQFFKTFAYDG